MSFTAGFDHWLLPTVLAVVFLGGLATGLTGFGFAVVATAVLAVLLEPHEAVVLVVLPLLAANLPLLDELDRDGMRTAVRRFWPFLAATTVGTLAGMVLLARIPSAALAVGLGAVVLLYVVLQQPWVAVPGTGWLADRRVTENSAATVGLGLASGVVFGASNVGGRVAASLDGPAPDGLDRNDPDSDGFDSDGLDRDRPTVVGLLATILLGVSIVRVGAAWALGLYEGVATLALSALAAVAALAGIDAGSRLRPHVPTRIRAVAVFALLSVVGLWLLSQGIGT